MKQALTAALVFFSTSVCVSCSGYRAPSTRTTTTTGVQFRAFVSQDVSSVFAGAGLFLIDAAKDAIVRQPPIPAGNAPGLMTLSPNKKLTLVFSASNNSVAAISNATESSIGSVSLPGPTESMAVSQDGSTGYAAVSSAPVAGQSPGAVEVLNLTGGSTIEIGVTSARYLVASHNTNRLLVFSDNSDVVTVIAPSNIGTSTDPRTFVPGFDRPVWGVFSTDDTTAYILNCGPECGGQAASVQTLDLTQNPPVAGPALPVPAATVGLLTGSTLYVAGTPLGTACDSSTAATSCGVLSVVAVASMTLTNPSPIIITDGYHKRMGMGSNGQLFVGARTCTEISTASEVRGCLSIFNTANSSVVVPPENGDVTGLEPIANRDVVYVVQGGELRIFNTTTDKLGSNQVDIAGQAIDVKSLDF